MPKKRVTMARLIKQGDDDGSFDREFWRRVGPEGIFRAMIQMIIDYAKWRKDDIPTRLQRSVAVLKRKER